MKRLITGGLTSCAAVVSALIIGLAPAWATSTTSPHPATGGSAHATVTWLSNGGVSISGSVTDTNPAHNPYEQIRFTFWHGGVTVASYVAKNTSSTSSYSFTKTGSSSITHLEVYLCNTEAGTTNILCTFTNFVVRP